MGGRIEARREGEGADGGAHGVGERRRIANDRAKAKRRRGTGRRGLLYIS